METTLFSVGVNPFSVNAFLLPIPNYAGIALLLTTSQGAIVVNAIKGCNGVIEDLMKQDFRFFNESPLLKDLAFIPNKQGKNYSFFANIREDRLVEYQLPGPCANLTVCFHRVISMPEPDAPGFIQDSGSSPLQVTVKIVKHSAIGGL